MANRHLSRSVVMQTLFEWDFRDSLMEAAAPGKASKKKEASVPSAEQVEATLVRNAEEFAPGMGDFSFMKHLALAVLGKRDTLDDIIEKAAPDWPIERISVVDRNILRLGLYELLFSDRSEVPPKVAINEAIELAKTFGGENSGKFVNGVLGAVYKEMGEPEKDQTSAKKKNQGLDLTKLPLEKLGGAVIYSRYKGESYLALVHDIFGHWTLSKGHIAPEEDEATGTAREIKEELGIDVSVIEKLGENEYVASHPEKGKIRKRVSYFLAETPYQELKLEKTGGLDDARWFPLRDMQDLNIYDDILPLIAKGVEKIRKPKTESK
ncbi:transcription antitermination factor NusB [Candidatus Parcubacteria bacterium]|nr:transcription antitermination factor NusB [Candidatus Parcubacteria bacterium]